MEKTYRFLPYLFATFLVVVIYCFYQSYFSHIPDFQHVISPIGNAPITITTITHFHVLMFILWFLLLIIQPILIIRKKYHWHRILGKTSYIVVGLLFISFLLIINQEQTREKNLQVFSAALFDVPVFMAFYCLAIYFRKKPAYHARFMVMSILPFINPALARANIAGVPVQLVVWVLLFVVEFFTRKTYKPYLIGLGYYIFNLAIIAYLILADQPLLDKIWYIFF
jgi:hypothetical protein